MKTFTQMVEKDNYPKYIIIHHFGGTDKNPLADTSNQTFEIVRDYHISKGWENIGYHYVIEKSGKVTQGRPDLYHGAHTIGYNHNSIGVALDGNFDSTLPSKEQVVALTLLLKNLQTKYTVQTTDIVPHRKFANKTCYGKLLSDTWASDLVKEEDTVAIPRKLLIELSKYII